MEPLMELQIAELEGRLEQVYTQRAIAVAVAVAAAHQAGWDVARRFDESKNMWVIYVATPAGQVSWHIADAEMPMFAALATDNAVVWDGKFSSRSTLFGAEVVLNRSVFSAPLDRNYAPAIMVEEAARESNSQTDTAEQR